MTQIIQMKSVLRASSACSVLLAGMAIATPALAQAAPNTTTEQAAGALTTVDDIVVTARRKEEASQRIPVTLSALSGAALTERGITRASDVGSAVPGVFSSPGGNRGSQSPIFAIRGQVNRDQTMSADPSVGFYFADVPWARPQGINSTFVDLESVQVLKGPQGTLFGRNSTAGAILVTPKAPTDKFEGYVKGTTGNYGLIGLEGVINIPLNDTLMARFVGSTEKRRGYLRAQTGELFGDVNNQSLRATLRWEPADNFDSSIIAGYFNSDTNGDGSRIFQISPVAPSVGAAALRPLLIDAISRTAAAGRYGILTSFSPLVANALRTDSIAQVRTWNVQNNSTLHLGEVGFLGDVVLKNIISYRDEKDFNSFDTVAIDRPISTSLDRQKLNQFTEEFQVQGTTGRLNYILGAFYFRESGREAIQNFAGNRLTRFEATAVNTSYSAFAHATYNFTPDLAFSAGLRFNNDKRFFTSNIRAGATVGLNPAVYNCFVLTGATGTADDGSPCKISREKTFRQPTWNANLSYNVSANSLLYASVARGYRSGGFSIQATSLQGALPYNPEKVTNYEIGTKNDFNVGGWGVRLNAAAFYTDYKDVQRTLNVVNPSTGGILGRTVNAARARIFGTEFDMTVRPTSGIELSLSYAYLDPKYKKFNDIYRETNPLYIPAGSTGVNYDVDVSDSKFILISKHSLSASASFNVPLEDGRGDVTLRASYYYRSSFFTTNDINTPNCSVPGNPNPGAIYVNCYYNAGRLPGYGIVNLRLDWDKALGSQITASLFVNNLTDKYYYSNSSNVLGALGVNSGLVGAPRMFGASLKVPFGE